jgi:hypothetical protein
MARTGEKKEIATSVVLDGQADAGFDLCRSEIRD